MKGSWKAGWQVVEQGKVEVQRKLSAGCEGGVPSSSAGVLDLIACSGEWFHTRKFPEGASE